MFVTKSFLILGLFCVGSVISERVICDFQDSKCLTETAGLSFEQFIDGIPGVQSSEPLYQKHIEVTLPTLFYKFTDAKLAGMKKCKVELVKITAKDLTYNYNVGCPHLTFTAAYEINGEIGPQHVEGKGDCQIDFYDYHFLFHGDYVSTQGKEGQSHINLKTHILELQADGKVVYDFKNLFDGDKEKSDAAHKWVNDHHVLVHNGTAYQSMVLFMGGQKGGYMGNVNDYLRAVSVQQMFSKEK